MEEERSEYIVWTAYFDSTIPRRLGRKVPLSEAVKNPSIKEILRACKELGLECEAEYEPRYPRTWYMHRGRVRVKFDGPKSKLLHLLGRKIVELRASRSGTSI